MLADLIKEPVTQVKVFGSSLIQIPADIMHIKVGISHTDRSLQQVFSRTRSDVDRAQSFLDSLQINEVHTSQVELSKEFENFHGQNNFASFKARVVLHIVLKKLDLFERLMEGLVQNGVNELLSTDYKSSRTKQYEREVRLRAVGVAREKAEIYAAAARVSLGKVLSIEDEVQEDIMKAHAEDQGQMKAIDPNSITVKSAVHVVFDIE